MDKSLQASPEPSQRYHGWAKFLLIFTIWIISTIILLTCVMYYTPFDKAPSWFDLNSEDLHLSDSDIEVELLRHRRDVLATTIQGNSRLYCENINPCLHVCHDWLESYLNLDQTCLKNLTLERSQSESFCTNQLNPRPLIMGESGGDPGSACENTFEATEAGIAAGMNAVRLDVSMSTEGTLFLWRDFLPESFVARIRQNGLMFVSKCKPMYLPKSFRPAHTLTWGQIRSSWFYTDMSNSPQDALVPTLEDWVFNFGLNDQIEKVWLDVHCPDFLVEEILIRAWKIFDNRGIANKLYYKVRPSGQVHFPSSLHFVTNLNFKSDVKETSQQLTNLINSALKNQEAQVITNEDFTIFTLLRKTLNKESIDLTKEKLPTEANNISLDIVLDKNMVSRIKSLANASLPCPNVIGWMGETTAQLDEMKCSLKNVEAIVTSFPARVKMIQCKPEVTSNAEASAIVEVTTSKSCNFPCPRMLWPVCGTDGKIYTTECALEKAACDSKDATLQVKTDGDCSPPVFALLDRQEALKQEQKKANCEARKSQKCPSELQSLDGAICGSDGKLYESRCLFSQAACVNPALKENTNCEKNSCSLVCSDEASPVCGTDRITYRNFCTLQKMSCLRSPEPVRLFYYGTCGKCDAKCPNQDQSPPVCGSDGITYQNKCQLYLSACLQNVPKQIVNDGKCKTPMP